MRPVLVLRALGLGDALAAVPALRGLRRAFPGHPLLLAAAGAPARLLAAHGLVDDVVPTTGLDGAPPGARLGPHLAVNLHGRGPQSHRLLRAGGPERLVAFGCPEAGVAGPAWVEHEHEVRRWCRLVHWAGGACDPGDLRLVDPAPAAAAPRTGPVVVHPGASGEDRRWPISRYAAVAGMLAAAGHPVVVTGSAAEARRCRQVVVRAGLDRAADLSGLLELAELGDLLQRSRLLVCGDTGVAHLGTACGTPSVLLFGPVPPSRWGPAVDSDRHRVLWHGPAVPRPARSRRPPGGPDPLLLRITVDEVLAAATATLPTSADAFENAADHVESIAVKES